MKDKTTIGWLVFLGCFVLPCAVVLGRVDGQVHWNRVAFAFFGLVMGALMIWILMCLIMMAWSVAKAGGNWRGAGGIVAFAAWGTAVANFVVGGMIQSLFLGGTAMNGDVVGGRYFLGQYGNYTEVSAVGYWASYAYTLFSGLFVAISAITLVWLIGLGRFHVIDTEHKDK